jgi:hypothetical protein
MEGWGGRATFNYNANMVLRDNPRAGDHRVYFGEDYGTLDLQANYRSATNTKSV